MQRQKEPFISKVSPASESGPRHRGQEGVRISAFLLAAMPAPRPVRRSLWVLI